MNPASKPTPIEVEVLPPEKQPESFFGAGNLADPQAIARIVAYLMDNLIALPGTKRKLGLNPLLDLVPILGDGASAVISSLTLLVASRCRVPKVVIAHMGLNILLNSILGTIPGVGEIFAFWYRPNQRNYHLLKKHAVERDAAMVTPSTRRDWLFVGALVGGVMLVAGMCIVAGAYVFYLLFHGLSQHR
jgi:hypothetical protein